MGAEIKWTFDEKKIEQAVKQSAAEAINLAAEDLNAKMRLSFGSQGGSVLGKQAYRLKKRKDGTYYRAKSSKNKYGASPVGTPPGVRSGRLRNSITVVKATASKLKALVGTNLRYGFNHEFGYMGKGRDGKPYHVAARPWAIPTLNANRDSLMRLMASTFQEKLRSALAGLGVKQQ